MNYKNIISTLFTSEANGYVCDGISYSYPVTGLYDGKIVDCFFLYSVPLSNREFAEAPLSILMLDSEEGTLKKYQKINHQKIRNSINCDNETFWKANKDFEELYPQVRAFSFLETISLEQKETLNSFLRIFKLLVNDSFYEIYRKLFSEFFVWARRFL